MNKTILIMTFLLCIIANACTQKTTRETNAKWNAEIEKQHLLNRQDSSTWDYDLLNGEIEFNKELRRKSFRYGVFPIPNYDLLGENSFTGAGYEARGYREIGDFGKKLTFVNYFVYKNDLIEEYIPSGKNNEVFFTLIVLSDAIDTVNYSHCGNDVLSRNHPDYIGQGFIQTKNDEIDYMAFLTADRNEYAIVNMRLFNLKHGRIILIAPQKDGSLRSMQVKSDEILSQEDMNSYIDELFQQATVKKFFTDKNNI